MDLMVHIKADKGLQWTYPFTWSSWFNSVL